MKDKICLVTGANSGIGKCTALGLAKAGAAVVMVCRDRERGETALKEIRKESGNKNVELMLCDLSSQKQIRKLAADFKAKYKNLHVLANNAGLILGERLTTEDGLEYTFAVNHLAYFLLTHLLTDILKASAPSRIVNVSSFGHNFGRIYFDDLQLERGYNDLRAYNQSKLANIMFTYELARRLEGTGVSANCLHPGGVATNFGRESSLLMKSFMLLGRLTFTLISSEKGAETSVYLASSDDVQDVSGQYFVKKRAVRSSGRSYDVSAQKRLWKISEELCSLNSH